MSEAWREAACRGRQQLMFRDDQSGIATAKKLCRECPVQVQCLDFALTLPENPDGVWGGLDKTERRAVRPLDPRRRGPCGTDYGYRLHKFAEESACAECRAAHSEATARWQRNNRAKVTDKNRRLRTRKAS